MDLKSIKDENIFKIMTSSGTSGQAVSKIFLDKESSIMQTKILNHVGSYLGKKEEKCLLLILSQSLKIERNLMQECWNIRLFFIWKKSYLLA